MGKERSENIRNATLKRKENCYDKEDFMVG